MFSDQEDMLVHESTMQLLRLLKGLEITSINELESRVYRFILGISLEGYVFDRNKIDLQRI